MQFANTHCCALQEIHDLSSHSTAKEAMVDFCRKNLTQSLKYKGFTAIKDKLFTFYFFTAAVYDKYATNKKMYGEDFAKFINENKLGRVLATDQVVNAAFHPTHANQAWFWTPDVNALRTWWDNFNKPVVAKPEPPKPEPTCGCGAVLDVNGLCSEGCDDDMEAPDDDDNWDDEPYYDDGREPF